MIAYGIDENGNILLHTGWQNNPHKVLIVNEETADEYSDDIITDYIYNKEIIWLEINEESLPHTHAYNYIEKNTQELLCSCQIYSSHPEHENNHKYFQKTNANHLYEECACGEKTIIHVHDREYSNVSNYIHTEACTMCDYLESVFHSYGLISISSTQHQQVCACGKRGSIYDHSESGYKNKNSTQHNIVCSCGYVMGTASHNLVPSGNQRYRCTDCGALLNALSDIIIKKDDPEYELR